MGLCLASLRLISTRQTPECWLISALVPEKWTRLKRRTSLSGCGKSSLAGAVGKGWSCSIEGDKRIAPFGESFQQQKSAQRGQSEAGIDKKFSSRAQQLAGVPEQKFNKMIAECFRANGSSHR